MSNERDMDVAGKISQYNPTVNRETGLFLDHINVTPSAPYNTMKPSKLKIQAQLPVIPNNVY